MPPLSLSKLGRYEIVEELGKGAMGVVYLAKDPLIGRLVALKTFRVGFSAQDEELQQFRSRFVREAQSAGILSHPNIVTIHDVVDEADSGVCFIAMEYVRGSNLKTILQQPEPLPFEFVVSIISQVGDALDFAHSRGVIHRDVKPANILITADNKVKITDFGIARLGSSNLTMEGQLLGTPNYMAPEQIQGKEVDHRADIFSLGVVLYEMLTRRKPFQGENLTVVTHRIVHEPFASPDEHIGSLPPGIKAVIARALEKDPAKRYGSASQLAADLQKLLQRPAPAAPELDDTSATQEVPRVSAPAPPPAKSRRTLLIAGGAAALLLLLAGGLWLARSPGPPPPPPTPTRDAVSEEIGNRLAEGRELLAQGDTNGALARVVAAEHLRPDDPRVGALRREIEQTVRDRQNAATVATRVASGLMAAREALDRRRYDEAKVSAQGVLELVPGQPEALDIVRRAEEAIARQRDRPRNLPTAVAVGTSSPTAVPVASSVPPTATVVASREGTLAVDFHTEVSEGVLTIYADDRQIVREPFRFSKKSGLFRVEKQSGGFQRERTLASGAYTFRIYVALEGRPTKAVTVDGELSGGSRRTLVVRIGAQGEATARLD